jgi:hypothetical protein
MVSLKGVRTEGAMAEEISLTGQRPAEFKYEETVAEFSSVQNTADKRSDAA